MLSNLTPEKIQAVLAILAVIGLTLARVVIGEPTPEELREMANEARLDARSVFAHPAEVVDYMNKEDTYAILLDVRSEADYNNFHIAGAIHTSVDDVVETALDQRAVKFLPKKTVIFVMSNDEAAAVKAWRKLVAEEILNPYIICGGVNNWINIFADDELKDTYRVDNKKDDKPGYVFDTPIAEDDPLANPDPKAFDGSYQSVVTMGTEDAAESAPEPASGGGCG